MARDWEAHVYYDHTQLTRRFVDSLLARLWSSGLELDQSAGVYPALAGFTWERGRPRLTVADAEDLLRSRKPPRGAGYGVLPLRVTLPERLNRPAFLSFAWPDAATALDSVSLVVDGALLAEFDVIAFDAAFEWFSILCEQVNATYGWADWETATFLEASPTARDVRAGHIPRLMRFNAFGRSLLATIDDLAALESSAVRLRRLDGGAILFEPSR